MRNLVVVLIILCGKNLKVSSKTELKWLGSIEFGFCFELFVPASRRLPTVSSFLEN